MIKSRLQKLSDEVGWKYPYAMIQPTLTNRKEFKIIVLNKSAKFTCTVKSSVGIYFIFVPDSLSHANLINIYVNSDREGFNAHLETL